jgi:hypothetical protein
MDQERDGRLNDRSLTGGGRWQVVGTGIAVGAFLGGALAANKVAGSIADQFFAWIVFLAGPLNPRLWEAVPLLAAVSLLLSPAILAHPIRPNLLTGVATTLALAVWFFSGFGALAIHIGP